MDGSIEAAFSFGRDCDCNSGCDSGCSRDSPCACISGCSSGSGDGDGEYTPSISPIATRYPKEDPSDGPRWALSPAVGELFLGVDGDVLIASPADGVLLSLATRSSGDSRLDYERSCLTKAEADLD